MFYAVFMMAFAWVSGQLFFEKETDGLLASTKDFLFGEEQKISEDQTLTVMYAAEIPSFEPTADIAIVRQRLINIFEPLVRLDRDLNVRPSLALSWGMVDDLTWNFSLRPGVTFHGGSPFDAKDVVASLDRAMKWEKSELKGVLTSIEKVEILDDFNIKIKTYEPDPLLLQRLSSILIFPSELGGYEIVPTLGTGPYKLVDWKPGIETVLERNETYWGSKPKFAKVRLLSETDKSKRVNTFLAGEADILEFVPPDAIEVVKKSGFEAAYIPSLEVQFLLFNPKSDLLDDKKNREIISLVFDQKNFAKEIGLNARPVNQFVGNGIFGFNPYIAKHEFNLEKAKELAEKTGLKGQTLYFHLPTDLEYLGEHFRTQLNEIGVSLVVSYMGIDKLFESLDDPKADMYFFGFKSTLGDSADFLDTVIHTGGSFNFMKYSNSEVDDLIDVGITAMDPTKRLAALQEAMKILIEGDTVGLPLFEYELVYGFDDEKLDLQPRIDTYLYYDELTLKK